MKRAYTPEQQAAFSGRKMKFRALARKIGAMTQDERTALSARLPVITTIEGRALSMFNQCMLAVQCPSATLVGGFRQWINAGRVVRKGEHGAAIWVPMRPRKADGEQAETTAEGDKPAFMLGTVFDVSQTDEIQTLAEVA
jgi:hypothetical protein